MKPKLKQLLLLVALSATMAACTPNPVNNNGGTGSYTGGNTNTNTGGNTNSSGGENTNTGGNTNSSGGENTGGTYTGTANTNNGGASTNSNTNTGNNTGNVTDGYYTSSPSQRGFVVQLTASTSQQKAKTVKNTFVAEGYSVIQNNIETNGSILYRVQVGPYTTKSEARTVLNKMKKRYRRNPYVNSAIINENK